ncbi:MAG TPA: tRNA lysidine(34) synthetase TilS [Candidatus Sulfotelmatobacter sp.]|jgi:tRNA(Ile)-lysidine synthase|nr:tRNA lysidine(34) synthetase TilS [Candidatus Sulfotelmatobacter sp.]
MAAKKPTKKKGRGKRHELAELLRAVLRERFGVCAGERIGVAVSGGADSVALLGLFMELRELLGVVVCVVHFNHKLRGKASEADEKFVAKLAAQHGLEFFVERENVAAKAKRERANLEDAARRARYAFFEQLVKEGRVSRVAVAQTADDQAETVLAHMLRGTGLAGLAGIHPQAGSVFRPLLGIRRAALRSYLRNKHRAWREDATNKDETRTRARIRHQLMPLLEKKFQGSVVEHLCQLAELAREDNDYLDFTARFRLNEIAKEIAGNISVPVEEFAGSRTNFPKTSGEEPSEADTLALRKRMVREIVKRIKPRAGELGSLHVDAVLHLAQSGHSGKILQLPGGVEVRRERGSLIFRAAALHKGKTESATFSMHVHLPALGEELRLDALSRILHFRVIDWPSEGRETSKTGAVLDRNRLRAPLELRNWRPGDAMRPAGHQNRHTLARLLNELGASRWEKEQWPVLTSAGKVAWVLGLPVADEFTVAEGSRAAVVITEESSS